MSHLKVQPVKTYVFDRAAYRKYESLKQLGTVLALAGLAATPLVGWLTYRSVVATTWFGLLVLTWATALSGLMLRRVYRRRADKLLMTKWAISRWLHTCGFYLASLQVGEYRLFGTFDGVSIKVTRGEVSWFVEVDAPITGIEPNKLFSLLVAENQLELYLPEGSQLWPERIMATMDDVRNVIKGQGELERLAQLNDSFAQY